ncbi:hypothetical protein J2T02_002601 [Chitinophaga terrae (ex Kim and Jung 2007)]|uniref:hypothetical protein n=1 Tax=Chitinophaga terrae (ex Kim and Jung 2007) TaxID=408074 RepID=UPI00278503B4|nr:hypothetical protein [Chitinophaga terrae (ex Kim and Jung 2007)]MDQ0107482.1 hypothetical protein [Chitinophaga terrae (ex Kim and Jung 2007)]
MEVYILIKAKIEASIPQEQILSELQQDLFYDIAGTDRVMIRSAEVISVTAAAE